MTSVKSVLSVFKNPTHHAITKNIRVLRKIIRVIRAIRVQNPTHHALTRNIRVLRKNPCSITSITKQFVLPVMPNKMKYTYLCAEETDNPQNEHAT